MSRDEEGIIVTTRASQRTAPKWKGLTSQDVEESRRKHGRNILTPPQRERWYKLFLQKFRDPVIRILMIAAVIAVGVGVSTGEYAEGLGIIVAILLATTLAFLNEHRANQEFDILNKTNDSLSIKVIRDGLYGAVPLRDLVTGDLVLIEAGEEIPADGDLLEAVSLQVDESRLTGESMPVTKVALDSVGPDSAVSAYPSHRALRGTLVRDGHGVLQITAVGDSTEIGNTARASAEDAEESTPLNRQLERLSKVIGVVGFGVATLVFAALVARGALGGQLRLSAGQWLFSACLAVGVLLALAKVWVPIVCDALELAGVKVEEPAWVGSEGTLPWIRLFALGALVMGLGVGAAHLFGALPPSPTDWLPREAAQEMLRFFMIAVTIIVVAVPEGLAMSVTLSLAYSMRKMTASHNLVRRMQACETIGAATVICSDKTGTLTLNEMRVQDVSFPALCWDREGDDPLWRPHGRVLVEAIAANTTANLGGAPGDQASVLGNPTEGALLLWLDGHGVDYVGARAGFARTARWPFSTERKLMATQGVSAVTGEEVLYVKGAPEILLARCTHILHPDGRSPIEQHRARVEEELRTLQRRGMRTLALAYREEPGGGQERPATATADVEVDLVARDLTWLGFVAIADPVRDEVAPAVAACRKAGVLVKMVTGDNVETAREIARQIGLLDGSEGRGAILTGAAFEALTDREAEEAIQELRVLARARPMHKLRLVEALKRRDHVVAVTGDGTNDAPALNHANVGLAMGKTGTAIAKEASDIILLDDSFRSILSAIGWGRSLYENIQRFILFQLTINVVALGIALLGPFIGVRLPLTVTQMLWVNLIMDTFAALALAAEPPHPSVMNRPPRDAKAFIVTWPMARHIFGVGGVFLVFLLGLLVHMKKDGITDYKLSVFFTVFVMLQFWNLFNARCLGRTSSAFSGLLANKGFLIIATAIFVGQVLIIELGGKAFRTEPLTLRDWILIVGGTSIVLWIGELRRLFGRRTNTIVPNPALARPRAL